MADQPALQVLLPRHLGDCVLALAALRGLQRAADGRIALIGVGAGPALLATQAGWRVVPELWGGAPVLLLRPSLRAALLARFAGCPVRIGYGTDHRGWLLSHTVPQATGPLDGHGVPALLPREHMRDAMVHLAEATATALGWTYRAEDGDGTLQVPLDVEEDGRGARLALGNPHILIHPWAQGLGTKRWPASFWIDLGRRLRVAGRRVAVTGGPTQEDADFAQEIARGLAAPVAAGGTCLPPLRWAALARASDAVLAPDTGIAHVAAAAGARVHVLFGPTDPRRHAPLGPAVDVVAATAGLPCAPCYRDTCRRELRCQKIYGPDVVLERVLSGSAA